MVFTVYTIDHFDYKESTIGAKQRRLPVSNGRLSEGACDKIPITFAHSMPVCNEIGFSSLVCFGVFV